MGDCASYKAKVEVEVKVIEDENGVEFDAIEYLDNKGPGDLSPDAVIELLQKHKQNLLLDNDDETFVLEWRDEYEDGIPSEVYDEMLDDVDYFYRCRIYKMSKIKVSKKQVEDLKLRTQAKVENGYVLALWSDGIWESIYCDNDNSNEEDITKIVKKAYEIGEMGYEYRVSIKTDGSCYC